MGITLYHEATRQIIELLFNSHHSLRQINEKLDRLHQQGEKNMSDLTAEFTAFNDALTAQLAAINLEIQQVADAVAGGASAVAAVEDARVKITAATAAIQASATALGGDDPVPVP